MCAQCSSALCFPLACRVSEAFVLRGFALTDRLEGLGDLLGSGALDPIFGHGDRSNP
jgi:hypothetical protein|nr:hypothetical protein Q903MT_gene2605 [Picea sitchensis]